MPVPPPAAEPPPRYRRARPVSRPLGLLLIAAVAMHFTDWPGSDWMHALILIAALVSAAVDLRLRKKETAPSPAEPGHADDQKPF